LSQYLDALYDAPIERSVRRNLTIVSPSDSIFNLVSYMIRDNIGAAVVVEEEQWIGIITEKDILEQVLLPEKNPHQTIVQDLMTKSPISIEVDRPIKEALAIMGKHKIRRLIVTKQGQLFGLVTERRLLKLLNFRVSDLFEHLSNQ
jgi:predicted transcriptional regulator